MINFINTILDMLSHVFLKYFMKDFSGTILLRGY